LPCGSRTPVLRVTVTRAFMDGADSNIQPEMTQTV
jgi:hypothetical protein